MNYSMFQNWCRKIAEGYGRKNPYHTDLHAGDVTQTCFVFFKVGKENTLTLIGNHIFNYFNFGEIINKKKIY